MPKWTSKKTANGLPKQGIGVSAQELPGGEEACLEPSNEDARLSRDEEIAQLEKFLRNVAST
eukprot:693206-Amphidinium_carterae.1